MEKMGLNGCEQRLMFKRYNYVQGKGVRYQSCEAPFGPFGYWYLTPFPTGSHTIYENALEDPADCFLCDLAPRLFHDQ